MMRREEAELVLLADACRFRDMVEELDLLGRSRREHNDGLLVELLEDLLHLSLVRLCVSTIVILSLVAAAGAVF